MASEDQPGVRPSEAPPFEISQWRPRRSRPVLLGLIAALAALVGLVAWLASRPKPRSHRLLVAIQTKTTDGTMGAWWADDGQASGRCADRLASALRSLGLEIVGVGEPGAQKALEGRHEPAELREAARQLDAGLALSATLEVVSAQPLTGGDGASDFAMVLAGELHSLGDAARVDLDDSPLRIHQPARSEAEALVAGCDQLAERLTPRIARAVVGLSSLEAALGEDTSGRSLEDQVTADRLAPLTELAATYRRARDARSEAEERMRERDAKQERGSLQKELLGPYLGEEYFVGSGPGDGVVTMTLPTWLSLTEPGKAGYRMRPEHEQLLLRAPDGAHRRVLVELFNLYSFPSITADGSSVAYVADHRQWSKALQIVQVSDGSVTELTHHRSHYFSNPVIAPDGSRIAFGYGPTRHGAKRLEIVDRDGADRRVLVPGPVERMELPGWSPESAYLFVVYQAVGEVGSSLWRIDAASGEQTALVGPATMASADDGRSAPASPPSGKPSKSVRSSSFHSFAVASDGSFVAVAERNSTGSWLGRYDTRTGSYRRLVRAPVERIAVAPGGERIAFETVPTGTPDDPLSSDVEIAIVSADGGPLTQVTVNALPDDLAGWSRDGKRLYFHQGNRDPDGRRYDNRVLWVEP